jgi:hypothetical protein
MGRISLLACTAALVAVAGAGTAGAQSSASRSWATPQIRSVVAAGLMAPSVAEFRPEDALTWRELATLRAALGAPEIAVSDVDREVTVRQLDAQLVALAGLRPAARQIRLAALDAGLAPTPWLGTETVARLLGLRINHLKDHDERELQLSDPATRAEAAYSVARLIALQEWELEGVRQAAAVFALPDLTTWQRAVIGRALKLVGYPYVWAGTSEKPQQLLGRLLPGGFDCSGLVWRVYKLQLFAGAPALPGTLMGRTTYAMSGEMPRSARVTRAQLQPADVVFFGSRGPKSRPTEVGHMGIYLGNGWIVHSYRHGVTLQPMTGWYDTSFAWGRSPLAEAGLS